MSPVLLPLITALFLSVRPGEGIPPLPVLQAEGSHFEIGLTIGATFSEQIFSAIEANSFFNDKILQYVNTAAGASKVKQYQQTATRLYPDYVDEIVGMAQGANIDLFKLFLWNMQFEFTLLLGPELGVLPPPSCSDLYLLNGTTTSVIGHNEDGAVIDRSTGYIVNATLDHGDHFLAYCYPGQLCGNAFGYNFATETVTTCNAVFPVDIDTSGIGRNFLNRALLSQTYSDIKQTLSQVKCSSGFSLNVGRRDGNGGFAVSNFEVSSHSAVETVYNSGYGYHFNMYLHSPSVSQHNDTSSVHRLARIKELPPAIKIEDILTYLGDTKDPQYPIYRSAIPPDHAITIATAVFDLTNSMLRVYRDIPALSQPVMTVPLN